MDESLKHDVLLLLVKQISNFATLYANVGCPRDIQEICRNDGEMGEIESFRSDSRERVRGQHQVINIEFE